MEKGCCDGSDVVSQIPQGASTETARAETSHISTRNLSEDIILFDIVLDHLNRISNILAVFLSQKKIIQQFDWKILLEDGHPLPKKASNTPLSDSSTTGIKSQTTSSDIEGTTTSNKAQSLEIIFQDLKSICGFKNTLYVYPRKVVANMVFSLFRDAGFNANLLGFTNSYISMASLLPNHFLFQENILFNKLSHFLNSEQSLVSESLKIHFSQPIQSASKQTIQPVSPTINTNPSIFSALKRKEQPPNTQQQLQQSQQQQQQQGCKSELKQTPTSNPTTQQQSIFFKFTVLLLESGFEFNKEVIVSFNKHLHKDLKNKYISITESIIEKAKSKPLPKSSKTNQKTLQNPPQIIHEKQKNQKEAMKKNQNQFQISNGTQKAPSVPESLLSRSEKIQESLKQSEDNRVLDVLFVIDFECNQPGYEIIEFPIVVIDLKKQKIIDTFHSYVRPTLNPKIHPYIQKLTGITQKDVMGAHCFREVMQEAEAFLDKYKSLEGCILYDCESDCKYLRKELEQKEFSLVSDRFFKYINLRNVFPLEFSGGVINRSLSHAQQVLNMQFQGAKHKAIDDARNQALVCIELLKRGFQFTSFMIQPQFLKEPPKQCVNSNLFNLYQYNTNFLLFKLETRSVTKQSKPSLFSKEKQRVVPPFSIQEFKQNNNSTGQQMRKQSHHILDDNYCVKNYINVDKEDRSEQIITEDAPTSNRISDLMKGIKRNRDFHNNYNEQTSEVFMLDSIQNNMSVIQEEEDEKISNSTESSLKITQDSLNIPYVQEGDMKKEYLKFTCFLAEKNVAMQTIHRVKDSTYYFDFRSGLASGTGMRVSSATSTAAATDLPTADESNSKLKSFEESFQAYLANFGVERNKTAIVLIGFDKNEFLTFQSVALKNFNPKKTTTSDDELFFNEKVIYVDHNLVQFSGFLDIYKPTNQNQNGNASRRSSFSITPQKQRKRSQSEEQFSKKKKSPRNSISHISELSPSFRSTNFLFDVNFEDHPNQRSIDSFLTKKIKQNPKSPTLSALPSTQPFGVSTGATAPATAAATASLSNQTETPKTPTIQLTHEQIVAHLMNDDVSINFISFILLNRKKLQEYQDLAYHWQYINNKQSKK